jgi:type I restriction enzyme M protein
MAKTNDNGAKEEPIEKQLWKTADKLRKNIDAAEYKHIVLGLIFLKYISDAFENLHSKLKSGKGDYAGADPEDKDEYKAENVFFVPEIARWTYLLSKAKLPTVGKEVDNAMDAIEKENPSLKDVLPKVFARGNLDPTNLGGLIDLIGNVALGDAKARSADLLGHVFEYFLGEFALAEGKKGGQFYTPRSVVELLVDMLQPHKGRVYDPCCGSGGMFVQSEKFVASHQGKLNDISIYGQESNHTTWRLARMNLAIRGIDSSQVKWNNEGSFLNDAHKDLKADFVIANPPFNDSDWSGDLLRKDGRWKYGVPSAGNANYAWIQHFLYHLSPSGVAGFVLAKGSLTSKSSGEGEIRKALIEARLVDCIVNLPAKLFLNTQIPASLWFLRRIRGEPSPKPSPNGRGSESGNTPDGKECNYRGNYDFSGLLKTAKELRKSATPAEQLFWELVRDHRFLNLKFRRQHQIGDYIVDFYCDEKKLAIEFDGAVHNTETRQAKDHKRDAYLKSIGLHVLRIANEKILSDTESVLQNISNIITTLPQRSPGTNLNPLPAGGSGTNLNPLPAGGSGTNLNPLPAGGSGTNLNPLPLGEGRVRGTGFRSDEILFIDARNIGHLINRRTKELSDEDIMKISNTYRLWKSSPSLTPSQKEGSISSSGRTRGAGSSPLQMGEGQGDSDEKGSSTFGRGGGEGVFYEDIKGFCNSASVERVRELDYVLTPGRYVGLPDDEDDFDFKERFPKLKAEFEEQLKEEAKLNALIKENLAKVKIDEK